MLSRDIVDVGEDHHLTEVRLLDQEQIADFPRDRMPKKISPPGLTAERNKQLYENARQYIDNDQIRDEIYPL